MDATTSLYEPRASSGCDKAFAYLRFVNAKCNTGLCLLFAVALCVAKPWSVRGYQVLDRVCRCGVEVFVIALFWSCFVFARLPVVYEQDCSIAASLIPRFNANMPSAAMHVLATT